MKTRLALVDLDPVLPNLTSQLLLPRHDVLAVGTAVKAAGRDVDVFVEAWNGVPFRDLGRYDVVGAAVTGSNMSRVAAMFRDIRRQNPKVVLVAGGPHATLIPTDVARFADVVIRDEGEDTLVEVLLAIEEGRDVLGIAGVSVRRGERTVHGPRRPFRKGSAASDLSLLRGFRRKSVLGQLAQGGVYTGYATASRGCPFPCTFCYENMIGGTGFRKQGIDAFIEDVRRKRDLLGTTSFWLADSNFTTHPEHCRQILQAIVDADLGVKFSALCRTDLGDRPELLELMRKAGFESAILGIETVEDEVLIRVKKKQTVSDSSRAIRNIQSAGIGVYGLFMLGFDQDTAAAPRAVTAFAEEHDLKGVSIYLLCEYESLPGRTLPRYRICETNLDYYNGHFVTTFPMRVRPSELERASFEALLDYHPRKALRSLWARDTEMALFHGAHYAQLLKMWAVSRRHQETLRRVERPYYRADGTLDVEALKRRPLISMELSGDLLSDWEDPDEIWRVKEAPVGAEGLDEVGAALVQIGRKPVPAAAWGTLGEPAGGVAAGGSWRRGRRARALAAIIPLPLRTRRAMSSGDSADRSRLSQSGRFSSVTFSCNASRTGSGMAPKRL
ncbi:MAG: radical SAM protein [Polyangiaceae bacterium]